MCEVCVCVRWTVYECVREDGWVSVSRQWSKELLVMLP